MAKISPQVATEKWQRRTTAAVQDMITGVQAVTVNPAQLAIEKEQKMVQNFNAAMQDGKWKRSMGRVTLDDWKSAMQNKGAPRVAAGVQNAGGKMVAFMSEFLPFQETIQQKLATMPDITSEDAINRMVFNVRETMKFRRSGR